LGDDALAVLKDIKRWLKLYDEKLNSLDVARVLAERNVVKGDLLEILSLWPEDAIEDKFHSRIVLACSMYTNSP
jgi:replication fork protection complex subunit Tof1/Swi1